jgi:hypothetical protein
MRQHAPGPRLQEPGVGSQAVPSGGWTLVKRSY